MDTRQLRIVIPNDHTVGMENAVHIEFHGGNRIAFYVDVNEAEELVKRFNAHPQLHGMLSALYESGLQTGSYPSQASLGAVHDWYETQVAGATPSSSGDPFTVVVEHRSGENFYMNGQPDIKVVITQADGTDADQAAARAIDLLIEKSGALPEDLHRDTQDELDRLRAQYKVIAIYPGHLQNLVK